MVDAAAALRLPSRPTPSVPASSGYPYRGSLGSTRLNAPIVGMAACGGGHLLGAADRGVFNFSDCPFYGSLAAGSSPRQVAGLASLGH